MNEGVIPVSGAPPLERSVIVTTEGVTEVPFVPVIEEKAVSAVRPRLPGSAEPLVDAVGLQPIRAALVAKIIKSGRFLIFTIPSRFDSSSYRRKTNWD